MKKSLLFLLFIVFYTIVNAQSINNNQLQKTPAKVRQKVVENPNHSSKNFKAVKDIKMPISSGYARVTLTAGDSWGDGS